VLRAHPFIDGNHRAGIAALNAGLVMFGLDIVTFKDLERHDELLAIAFVGTASASRSTTPPHVPLP
jgi:prophage maintenance system killer protein